MVGNRFTGNRMPDTKSVLAAFAHPDDIEFVAAGTLLLLREKGYQLHYINMCSGSCGTAEYSPEEARKIRKKEGQSAAAILGATFYDSIADDVELVYSVELLRKLAAVVREAKPEIVLTHSPQDYMEDHMNASRLAVSAAFIRGMPNFICDPETSPCDGEVAVYHAMPHGLIDGLRRPVEAEFYVDTGSVHKVKRKALAAHESQKNWLDRSQGMDSYLITMDEMSHRVGEMAGDFAHAEGWRRHSHMGFSASAGFDPLGEVLKEQISINTNYDA